jgi:serine protease
MRPVAVLAVAVTLTACLGGAALAEEPTDAVRFVVRTAVDAPTRAEVQRTVGSLDVTAVRSLGDGVAAVTVDTADPAAAAARLNASPVVSGASAERRYTIAGAKAPRAASDRYFDDQWDLWDAASTARAGGYGVDAPRAWTRTYGSPGVVVAVLDTGITRHPDLTGATILPGYDFVSQTDGIDPGDGNGWDADPTDAGDACAETGEDASSWHGTFVTGEIVAQHQGDGVAGQAPGVAVEPVRVLGACGGIESDTIAAIEWASGGTVPGVPANPSPASVLSLSLGSPDGRCSPAMQTAVDDAIGRGAVVVAAAGNDGSAVRTTSPANCAGVVSVAASTRSGTLADYSNRGTASLSPTIAAPGGSPTAPVLGDSWTRSGRAAIAYEEGTSMATPRVSAAVALLLSVRPGLTPAQVTARLVATVTPFRAAARCTAVRCGPGIVNAGNLVGATRRFVHASRATISGTARPGHRLVAHPGTWRAKPERVRYRWLRDGRPIAHATARTYRLTAKDAGHRIGVRVQVLRTGTATAQATASARRVAR